MRGGYETSADGAFELDFRGPVPDAQPVRCPEVMTGHAFQVLVGDHEIREMMDGDSLAPGVVVPEAPAGSVVLFSEALTHGTAPWNGAHQRRTLLYKYCQSHLAWSARRVQAPASVPLTPRQQLLFQEPANPGTWTTSLFAETAANPA